MAILPIWRAGVARSKLRPARGFTKSDRHAIYRSKWRVARSARLPSLAFFGTTRGVLVQVLVRDNNVDQALRALKKKMQREGIFREMKLRRNFEKPSERKAREKAEAVRRYRKLLRKRLDREGY
jgi:small subunit ribosomal protein S21